MNLFDIMRAAGGGSAFATLAPQYGLTEAQVARAVEAFLPAFSAGLKQSTADPLGLIEFMRKLSGADYLDAYRHPASIAAAGSGGGNDALRFLFGSQEVAQGIAKQANALTGIATEKLSALMPALAAMTLGGIANQAATANPVLDGMLKGFRTAPEKKAEKGPLDRYEEEQERREKEAAEAVRKQAELMQAGLAAFSAGAAAWQESVAAMLKSAGGGAPAGEMKTPAAGASGADIFGELFEPGLRVSEAYRREMEKLVARAFPATSRS